MLESLKNTIGLRLRVRLAVYSDHVLRLIPRL